MASRRRRALAALAVAAGAGAALAGPAVGAFPGLNGKIAFEGVGIEVKEPGFTEGDTITSEGGNIVPSWSPDGSRIAFVSNRVGGRLHVFTMNADGTDVRGPLSSLPFEAFSAAWSPDGTRIAFDGGIEDNTDIFVMNANGTGQRMVAGGPGFQDRPVWTPDGAAIVFEDSALGNGLGIVSADGQGQRPFLADAQEPDFSPEGSRLAIRRPSDDRIWVVNADGSGGGPITAAGASAPAFSPDGNFVVFQRPGPTEISLYTVPSGGGFENLELLGAPFATSPDWQAVGPPPAITGLSGSLVAGSPGATLTVDGSGFVRRSVVRWNGQDRPTTFAGLTRLVAHLSADDLGAPGAASVQVFTSPVGGGLSAPVTATVAPAPGPPPPRAAALAKIVLRPPKVAAKYVRSRLRGTVRVAGTLEAAGRVEIALLRGPRVVQRRFVTLKAGPFSRSVRLSARLVPGTHTLRVSGAGLATAEQRIRIKAPKEGVVSRAFVSAILNGPGARTLRGKSRLFAHFRFAARPKKGVKLTTTWRRPGGAAVNSDGKSFSPIVTSFIGSSRPLPTGTWRCDLRAGKTLVAVATVRLR